MDWSIKKKTPSMTAAAVLLAACCLLSTGSATAQTRRVVVEEFTGTWCGNCPRGIVGLERLAEDFGDRVICIAVHQGSNEPMVIATYPDLVPGSGGIPACTVDRKGKLDPYSGGNTRGVTHYGIDVEVAYELAQPADADLTLTAQWNDAQQWDVRFTATTTFAASRADAPYRLAFILLADGLKGQGRQWEQVNYFSQEYDPNVKYLDDDMAFWRQAPYYVADMEYNHVPVNTLGIRDGIAGSIQAPIVAGTAQTYSNTVTTLNVRLIQDKERLSAVALLLNSETGEIVNAARAPILPYGTDAVPSVAVLQQQSSPQYDLQGRAVKATPSPYAPQGGPKGVTIRNNRKYIKH